MKLYDKIVEGKFISRPNRFIANVEINGAQVTAHVKNTGRCKELLIPGVKVYLEDYEGRMGSRKMRYSLVAVEKKTSNGKLLVNIDSQAPNKVVEEALANGIIYYEDLGPLDKIRPETTYGDSGFDFFVQSAKAKGFIEVKGCTLELDRVCAFPDAPTERGLKHIEELIVARENGLFAGIVFAVQMEGMEYFVPNDEYHPEFGATHPAFGDALRKAKEAGVIIRAFECNVNKTKLEITREIPVK